jgi:flagellar basal-body rod protein FlgC
MINTIGISLSGLQAAAKKLDNSASNIANADNKGSFDVGGKKPYEALDTKNVQVGGGGVKAETVPRSPAFVPSFDPGSPFADENGIVAAPNVNLGEEITNSLAAEQAYKANALMIEKAQELNDLIIGAVDKDA